MSGLESGPPSYPLPSSPSSLGAFPAGSSPIWSQVNLWHNSAWKCMEILPITIKAEGEAASPVPSLVCCLLAPSLPETTGSQEPACMAQIIGVGHLYKTLDSSHLALEVCGRKGSFTLNLSRPGKCHSPASAKPTADPIYLTTISSSN